MSEVSCIALELTSPEPGKLVERSPEQLTWKRYNDSLEALISEAYEQESADILVDALTFALAVMVVDQSTPYVAGDALRMLGDHICGLTACEHCEAEIDRATAEAEQARKEGRKPQ